MAGQQGGSCRGRLEGAREPALWRVVRIAMTGKILVFNVR